MENRILRKCFVVEIILLFIGANFVTLAMSAREETTNSNKIISSTPERLMPDKYYLIIGRITDLHQEEGLIKFTVVSTVFIEVLPFKLKYYNSGSIEFKPGYIGVVMLHFIFAYGQSNIPSPSKNYNKLKNHDTYNILPGQHPPEIVFGRITDLDTRENISFTSTKRTWFVTWDFPFPTNFTIAPYDEGKKIYITPPMYFRIITPRFVFIVAYGITVVDNTN